MRLLKREKSGWFTTTYDFSLTEFDPQDAPQYAILSHRWGPDEVVFKDLENGTAKTKDGYEKLKFCGEQAARDGLLYFWIDTCCIDKASSSELSEAINSMFKWYRNATKCYVYLSDVSAYDSVHGMSTECSWELTFQKSVWFKRGWTLQELIAPTSVEFFSADGKKLGDKRSLERQIHQITKISIEALQGKCLSGISEKERFSWTARRQTTVEKDSVYCLLGIFDIHMSLMYGEGQQKALARLQRKIQRSSVAINAPWFVPFERNPRFTGRKAQLDELEGKLFAKDHTSKIAITGLGGVGKMQLVLEFLYRTKEKHTNCAILWIPATNIVSLQQGYFAVARQLEIPGCEDDKADVKQLVRGHLNNVATGQWVLVFDNADDIDMWTTATAVPERENVKCMAQRASAAPCRLTDYLPTNKRGCIIFTTRTRKVAVHLAQQNIIKVPEMSEEVAIELLRKCLIGPHLVNFQRDATALLSALSYLPLAIAQAAAFINKNEVTLTEYLLLLEEAEEKTIDLLSKDFEDDGRYPVVKNPVATTWLISFEQIRQQDSLAAEYLSFIACVHPRDIPQSLLPLGTSRIEETEAIGTLTAYSFVSRRPTENALDVHRLVYLATRNWLRKEGSLSQWMEKSIIRLEEVFPDNDHKHRSVWRSYLPHARRVLESDLVNQEGERRMALMLRYGMCLSSDGRWNEAEAIFTQVLARSIRTLSVQGTDTLASMAWLASTYRNQGLWKEAEQLEVLVIEICKTKLGADHPETLAGMANLASTYLSQSRRKEAEQLAVQVMEIRRMKLGVDHPDTLTSMANLASTYMSQGRWEEAEQLCIQVKETSKTKLGADHPTTLASMNNLAFAWKGLGRGAEAVQLMENCVQHCTRIWGAEHPYSLSFQNTLDEWEKEYSEVVGGITEVTTDRPAPISYYLMT